MVLMAFLLTLCLLGSSAENSLDPDKAQRRALSGSKLFDALLVFLREFLKKLILKRSADDKNVQNYPVGKVLIL